MTLVLTELSEAGIAMAADSAITFIRQGRIQEANRANWKKLLRVPRITAAVSYWGMIGAVTTVQFDLWLQRVIGAGNYTDLHSFADHLVDNLNAACHNRLLSDQHHVGLHVAGYAEWPDGVRRPMFIHVHNGHGHMNYRFESDEERQLIAVHPSWVQGPRTLFEKHQDFPRGDKTVEENIESLRNGYITRNGDYSIYALIWGRVEEAMFLINKIPGVSIPRSPTSLRSRKGLLHVAMETIISIYRCSSLSPTIGGTVSSLGVASDRYV